jgi:hypothetical protein
VIVVLGRHARGNEGAQRLSENTDGPFCGPDSENPHGRDRSPELMIEDDGRSMNAFVRPFTAAIIVPR